MIRASQDRTPVPFVPVYHPVSNGGIHGCRQVEKKPVLEEEQKGQFPWLEHTDFEHPIHPTFNRCLYCVAVGMTSASKSSRQELGEQGTPAIAIMYICTILYRAYGSVYDLCHPCHSVSVDF